MEQLLRSWCPGGQDKWLTGAWSWTVILSGWMLQIFNVYNKVCVFDVVQVFNDKLSLHFYNQSEINSKDNTIWGCRRLQELQLERNDFISPQYCLLVNYKEDLSNFQASRERSSFRSVYWLSLWRWFLDSFNILTRGIYR